MVEYDVTRPVKILQPAISRCSVDFTVAMQAGARRARSCLRHRVYSKTSEDRICCEGAEAFETVVPYHFV